MISHSVEIRRGLRTALCGAIFRHHTESILIENRASQFADRFPLARFGVAQALDRAALARHGYIRDVAFEPPVSARFAGRLVFASALVPVLAPVTAYAVASFPPGGGILSGAADLMRRIRTIQVRPEGHRDLNAAPGGVREAPRRPCQDFAHVMIAGLRGLGRPRPMSAATCALFPPPGKPRLAGRRRHPCLGISVCGAELGWVGFDPTNDVMSRTNHIILAIGRDFLRFSPVDASLSGFAQAESLAWPWSDPVD